MRSSKLWKKLMYHRKLKLLFIWLSKIQLNLISSQLQPILLPSLLLLLLNCFNKLINRCKRHLKTWKHFWFHVQTANVLQIHFRYWQKNGCITTVRPEEKVSLSFSLKQNPTKCHTHFFLISGNLSSSFEQTSTTSGRRAKWMPTQSPETQKQTPAQFPSSFKSRKKRC